MKFLQEFRKRKNKTQQEMADILGVSKSYYEKIEYSNREPSREFMEAFKRAFPDFDMNIFFEKQSHEMCSKLYCYDGKSLGIEKASD